MSFLIVTRYIGPTDKRDSRVKATFVSHLGATPRKVVASVTSGKSEGADTRYWHELAAIRVALEHTSERKAWRERTGLADHTETLRILGVAETHDGRGYAFVCEL